jgi:hypothetical protein
MLELKTLYPFDLNDKIGSKIVRSDCKEVVFHKKGTRQGRGSRARRKRRKKTKLNMNTLMNILQKLYDQNPKRCRTEQRHGSFEAVVQKLHELMHWNVKVTGNRSWLYYVRTTIERLPKRYHRELAETTRYPTDIVTPHLRLIVQNMTNHRTKHAEQPPKPDHTLIIKVHFQSKAVRD